MGSPAGHRRDRARRLLTRHLRLAHLAVRRPRGDDDRPGDWRAAGPHQRLLRTLRRQPDHAHGRRHAGLPANHPGDGHGGRARPEFAQHDHRHRRRTGAAVRSASTRRCLVDARARVRAGVAGARWQPPARDGPNTVAQHGAGHHRAGDADLRHRRTDRGCVELSRAGCPAADRIVGCNVEHRQDIAQPQSVDRHWFWVGDLPDGAAVHAARRHSGQSDEPLSDQAMRDRG